MDNARRVYRSTTNRMIGGVAGGLATYFNVDLAISRIVWGLLLFVGIGIPLYILCWIAIPRDPVIRINVFGEAEEPRRSTFGGLLKFAVLFAIAAIFISEIDRDAAIVSFLIGLGFGLYHLWRNRVQDEDAPNRQSRLYRSETNRRILGVFGGLGDLFDIDPTLLRIVAGVVVIVGFPVLVPLYLIYAMLVPTRRLIAA
jgi:phage shock protein C